jgi:hypothetical protein
VRDLALLGSDVKNGTPPTNMKLGGVFELEVQRHKAVQKAIEAGDPDEVSFIRRMVGDHRLSAGRRDYESVGMLATPNLIPDLGINLALDLLFFTTAKVSTWYAALFTSDSTPLASWASNWAGVSSGPVATELPNNSYDENGRQALVFSSAAASKSIASGVTVFTLASGVSALSVYGLTINSTDSVGYNLSDRILFAATRFDDSGGSTKTGLGATDKLNASYTITGASS